MSTDREELGRNITNLRVLNGLNQSELSRLMKARGQSAWHQTTVSRTEKGERELGLIEGLELAAVLGVSVDQLVGGEVPGPQERNVRTGLQLAATLIHEELKKIGAAS